MNPDHISLATAGLTLLVFATLCLSTAAFFASGLVAALVVGGGTCAVAGVVALLLVILGQWE